MHGRSGAATLRKRSRAGASRRARAGRGRPGLGGGGGWGVGGGGGWIGRWRSPMTRVGTNPARVGSADRREPRSARYHHIGVEVAMNATAAAAELGEIAPTR